MSKLAYSKLNDKEKFKRTLITIPFYIATMIFLWVICDNIAYNLIATIVVGCIEIWQISTTYKNSKK